MQDRWGESELRAINISLANGVLQAVALTEDGLLDLRGFELQAMILGGNFTGVDFSFLRMTRQAQIAGGCFEDCCFHGARIMDTSLKATFINCDFARTNLSRADMGSGRFSHCSFYKARIRKLRAYHTNFDNCDFRDSELSGSSFHIARLNTCDFRGAQISDVTAYRTAIVDCVFDNKAARFITSESELRESMEGK